MATETGTYEGGAGGKFRKRPIRKSSTPYDRPATGSHALRNPLTEEKRNGWLSRIVNPASRIITSSATRFFASMFQKRLTASASSPDVKIETIHQHPKTKPEMMQNLLKGKPEDFTSQEERGVTSSISNRLDDFERMLKDKTLSRDEFKRLTELLQSQVVDASKDIEGKRTQVNTLNAATTPMTKNNISTSMSGDVNNLITDETTASPTEIAKAFMGGRPSALSPAVSGLRSWTYREFASLTPNAQSFPHVIKSVTVSRFSGVSGSKEDAFFTPDSQGGRSVLYSPASPYPRPLTEVNREANGDSYIGLLGSSHWAHANDAPSIRKQVLKRRSSIFESDIGSINSMRRIRQKSNLMPSFKGNCLPSTPISLSPSRSYVRQSSVSSFQKPIQMPFQKCDSSTGSQAVENGGDKHELAKFAFVPPQSSERARKILEDIDKTEPSPKKKSTELQLAIAREKSPAKLTVGMLGGKALRSMEDIDMAKVPDRHVIASNGSDSFGKSFLTGKKDRMEENGRVAGTSEQAFKAPSKDGLTNGISNFADSLSGKMSTDSSVERHPQTRRPFQMAAPEMDEDSCNVGDVSAKSLAQIEKEKPCSENSIQKPLSCPPEKKPATAIGPLFTNGTAIHDASNFTFSVVPPLNSCSKPSSTLAVPLPVHPLPVYDKPVETEEHAIVMSSMIPSIAMTSVGDDPLSKKICGDSVGVDALSKNICGETKTGSSETDADLKTLAHQTNLGSYKDVEQRVDETAIPAVASVSSSSILSSFGTSSIPNLSSGSLNFGCSASQGSFAPLAPFSAVSNSTTITTSSALPSASSSIQFSTGNLYTASGASSPSSSRPELSDLTPKVSEKQSVFGKIGSASPTMPEKSQPVLNSVVTTTTSASGKLQISASAFGSTVPPVDIQLQAGTGTPVEDTRPSGASQFSSSASLPTFGLSAASTFGSGGSPFGSSLGSGPAISSSSLGSISFGAVDQTTSSSSTVLSASFGSSSQSQSLFSSGFSSPSPASSGFTFGGPSPGAASITSGLSFGGSASSAGSSAAGFSFGGSSAVTTSPASTGFSFGGFSSGSALLSSAVGSIGATTSASTLPSLTSGFSASGSSMGAATSSSCATGLSFDAPSVSSNTSSAAGFSVGGSSKGASASLSPATTGFSCGGSSVGSSTTSSSTASFSFGTPSAGSSSSVGTSFSFGLSPGASSPSTTVFSFGAGAASSPVATAFSFGASTSSNSVSFAFGSSGGGSASTGSLFSFTASASSAPFIGFASKTAPAPAQPLMAFASASPGNDQMNIEDSMAEDTFQASMAVTPAFTMASSDSSNFTFGSGTPSVPAGQPVFSFGAPQGGSTPPAPSPFAAGGGSLEFAGGSFSLGTNGGDKSGRKFVRIKRDKSRKK